MESIGNIAQTVSSFAHGAWNVMTKVFIQFLSLGYLLSQPCNQNPTNIAALILATFTGTITVDDLINQLILAVKAVVSLVAQANGCNLVQAIVNILTHVFKSVFSTVDALASAKFVIDLDFVTKITKATSALKSIFDVFVSTISAVVEYFGDHLIRYYGYLPSFMRSGINEVEDIIDKYKMFEEQDMAQTASHNAQHAAFVVDLESRLLKLETELLKSVLVAKNKIFTLPYVKSMRARVREVLESLPPHFRNTQAGRRTKPFWLCISGKPRIGKSTWFQQVLITLLAKAHKLTTTFQDTSSYCYTRVCGADFWDGYANHPVLLYDDLFQVYANEEAVLQGLDELTRVVNDSVYQLNMSQAHEKKGHYMTSKIVISNMQKDLAGQSFISQKCLYGGQHIYTRRNLAVELRIDAKYMTDQGIINAVKMHNDIDYKSGDHLVYKLIPKNAYGVVFTDPKTRQTMELGLGQVEGFTTYGYEMNDTPVVPVDKAIDYIINASLLYVQETSTVNNVVNDVCSALFSQMLTSEEDASSNFVSTTDLSSVSVCESENVTGKHIRSHAITCSVCFRKYDEMCIEQHWCRDHGCSVGCLFCIKQFSRASDYMKHLIHEHKLRVDIANQVEWYCSVCDLPHLRISDEHEHVICPMVEGTEHYFHNVRVVPTNLRITGLFNMIVEEIDIRTINLRDNALTPDQIEIYADYMQSKCEKCYNEYANLLQGNEASIKDLCVNLSMGEHDINRDYTWEELIARNTIGNRVKVSLIKGLQTFVDSWKTFITSTTYTLVAGAFALVGVVALASKYMSHGDVVEAQKGSSKKDMRRAKEQRIRQKGRRGKGKMNSIHEIDNSVVVIGKEGYRQSHQAQMYNNVNENIEKLIKQNMGTISILLESTEGKTVRESMVAFTNLWGSVFMTPKHFIDRVESLKAIYADKKANIKISLILEWPGGREVIVPYSDVFLVDANEDLDVEHLPDISFFYIQGIALGKDITKHFASIDDEVNLHGAYLYGYRSAKDSNVIQLLNVNDVELLEKDVTYTSIGGPDPFFQVKVNSSKISIPIFYMYQAMTINGDCGMLLLHSDHKIQEKIIGVHVAGNKSQGAGISNPIYKEDLEDLKEYLGNKFHAQAVVCRAFESQIVTKDKSANENFAKSIAEIMPVHSVISHYDIDNEIYYVRPNLPSRSKITESLMYDSLSNFLGPPTSYPARLAPFELNGEVVSPFLKALKKMKAQSPYVPIEFRQEIVDHIISTIRDWKSAVKTDFCILSEYEIFNGKDGLNPIDVTTSAGYPFKVMSKRTGKKGFVNVENRNGKHIYSPTQELRDLMQKREDSAKMGIIIETLFMDTLKDETRDLSKVEEGKTRMFQIGPMDLVLLTRKYCGSFISHCHTTYSNGEMAIGINPYSDDWDLLARRFKRFEKFLNGDFKNFDATIGLSFAWMIVDIINGVYDDSEENKLVRAVLILTCFCSTHLAYDLLYDAIQSNPSGCCLTTIFNCLVNMIIIRYLFRRVTKFSLSQFLTYVDPIFYGDDNLVGIADAVAHVMTMKSYSAIAKELGFEYTTTDKSDINLDHYNFGQVSFLTNTFQYVKHLGDKISINKYLAILDEETIHDIAFWAHGDASNMRDQLNRINMSLYYLRNHGLEKFTKYRKAFVKCVKELKNKHYDIHEQQIWDWQHVNRMLDVSGTDIRDLCTFDREQNVELHEYEHDMMVVKHFPILRLDSSELSSCTSTNNTENIFIAQMEVNTITTFVEQEINKDMNENVETEIIQSAAKEENLESFLKRPFLISTVAWAASHVIGTNLVTLVLPDALTAITAFKDKLQKFAFWAPDFEVTIRVNGTGLHYGRLVAFWVPQANGLSPSYKHSKTAFTHRWQQVDANSSRDIVIRIPFTHYLEMLPVGKTDNDVATLYLNVSVPLSMANGVAKNVYITTFVRCVEPRLRGFNYYNDFVAQMGIYSDVIRDAGKFVGSTMAAVGLGMAKPVIKVVSGITANVLDFMGLSTPINLATTQPMQISQFRLNKVIDTPNSTNLALSQGYVINDEIERTYGSELENDISYICGRPAVWYTGTITSSNVAGDILFNKTLNPTFMFYESYAEPATSPYAMLPANYFATLCALWRGSMKFTLSFIASNFHNCRVRVGYIPYLTNNFPPMTELLGGDVENIIIDLSDAHEVTFTVPYQQPTDWRHTAYSSFWNNNGGLFIQLINPLTSGLDPVNPIYFQLFVSMCEDFQLSCPTMETSACPNASNWVAQMDIRTSLQSPGESKACSMECLRKEKGICIGKPVAHFAGFRDTTNIIGSVLSFVKMAAYLGTWDTSTDLSLSPWGYWNVRNVNPYLGRTFLGRMETMFRYKKGGYRLTLIPDTSEMTDTHVEIAYRPRGSTAALKGTGTISEDILSGGRSYHNKIAANPVDVIIPYNSVYKVVPTAMTAYGTVANMAAGSGSVILTTPVSTSVPKLYLSAADDYRLSFQLGIPLVST